MEQSSKSPGKRKQRASRKPGSETRSHTEARYQAVIETSADGFCLCDPEGRIIEVNNAYVKRAGYSREELLSMRIQDLDARESPAETAAHIEEVRRKGSDVFETLHRTKDGTIWPVEVNCSYSPLEGGLFFSHLRDIGRRRHAEALLAARYRLATRSERVGLTTLMQATLDEAEILTGSRIGFFHVVDDDQEHITLQAWSTNTLKSMCKAEGEGKHDSISKAGVWADCFHTQGPVIHNNYEAVPHRKGLPESHAPVARQLALPIVRGNKVRAIIGMGNKTSPYTREDVTAVSDLASMVTDLMDERRAREAVRLNEKRLSLAMQATNQGWFDINVQTGEVHVSPEYARILGYEPAEFASSVGNWLDNIHPEDLDSAKRVFRECMASGNTRIMDYRRRRKSGDWIWLRSIGKVVEFDTQGKPLRMTGTNIDISEIKQREAQIIAFAERFEAVFNLVPDPTTITDIATGEIVDLNDAAARWFGLSRQEAIGKTTAEVYVWADPSDRERMTREMKEKGRIDDMAFQLRHHSGEIRSVLFSSRFIELNDRKVLLSRAHDITLMKRAEEALRATEERYRMAAEAGRIVAWRVTLSELRVDSGGALERMLGYEPGKVRDWYAVTHPDDRERLAAHWEAILRGQADRYDVEHRMLHNNGDILWVSIKGLVRRNDEGQLMEVVGTTQEITTQKQAEIRLNESEKKYRELVENANSIILMWDSEGRITFFNAFAQKFFGFPEEEIIGKHVVGTIVPETESASGRDLGQLMREICCDPDRFQDNENENITRDGRRVWVRWRNRAILDHKGQPVGILSLGIDETNRKQAEEALRESEAMLRQSQSVARVGHYAFNISEGTWDGSDVLYEIFGIGHDYQRTVEGWLHIVHPDERQEMLDYLTTRVLRDGKPFDKTYRIQRVSDRTPRWVHGLGNLEFADDGRPLHLFGTIQDVTERKSMEEALRESENRLNIVLNTVDAYIFIKDRDYRYTYVNRKVCELFGLSGMEIIGKRDDAFFSESSVQEIMLSDRPVIEHGETIARKETSLSGPDGRARTYWVVKVPLRDEAGRIYGLCGISTDITEIKNAEEALRESEARFRQIAETVNEVFWVGSPDWSEVHYISPAYEQVWGRSCSSLYADPQSWLDAVHPEDREAVAAAISKKARGGRFEPGFPEYRVVRSDGTVRWVFARAFPIYDEQGNVTRIIGVARDVTEHHLLDDERLKVQKLEAIGTLAGGIAHDFNNLLQGVFGYVSIAKLSANDPQKASRMLDEAEKALSLSVNLTNQLLTFAKGGKPVKRRIALGPVIENAVKFSLSGSRCDHTLNLPADLWPAEVDEGQISQVVQNVALNASEAMPAGGTIDVSAENMDIVRDAHPTFPEGGRFVRISIQDSGIGIPEAYLSKIFDPYFTTKQKGSGLGLASAYSIVKNHGGTIEVRSMQNVGTTFVILLPASHSAAPELQPTEALDTGVQRKSRILLMDDEEMIRNVGRNMVEALGHDIALAVHGAEAIQKFEGAMKAGQPFDLVILDLTVKGGMGGEETLRRLLQIEPNVKAVVSSGYSDDPIVSDYRTYGFSSLLNKPYSIKELRECLNHHLE